MGEVLIDSQETGPRFLHEFNVSGKASSFFSPDVRISDKRSKFQFSHFKFG